MSTMIEHFDNLSERGLKIIPLRSNSKAPLTRSWQKNWNYIKIREKFLQFPDSNIGLLLGDVIDVEGDDEYSNELLWNLIGDYPHPCYKSTRSVHHLFKTPNANLKLVKFREIEFRGHGHQSVLPPSQACGTKYSWICEDLLIPDMPKRLLKFFNKISGNPNKIKSGHLRTWCSICEEKFYLHKKRFDDELKLFQTIGYKWQCKKCRNIDLRPFVRVTRKHYV